MVQSGIWPHCASVGFFGFLSVFPVMAVFVLIYGLAFSASEIESQVAVLRPFLPGVAYVLLDARLKELVSNPTSHLTIGLMSTTLVALYMGSRGVRYMISLLNVAYHETESRNFLLRTLLAVVLTLGALLILILCLATLAVVPMLTMHLPFPHAMERLVLWGRWPMLTGVIFGSLLALYRFAPNRITSESRVFLPGAALATLTWLVLSIGFSCYVKNFGHYGATFGALSAGVVLMLWIYYSAFTIALGAALNFEIEKGGFHATSYDRCQRRS